MSILYIYYTYTVHVLLIIISYVMWTIRVPQKVSLTVARTFAWAPPVYPWPAQSKTTSCPSSRSGAPGATPSAVWRWPPVTHRWGRRRWTWRTPPSLQTMRWATEDEMKKHEGRKDTADNKQGTVAVVNFVACQKLQWTLNLLLSFFFSRLTWPLWAVLACWTLLVRKLWAPSSCAGLPASVSSWSLVSTRTILSILVSLYQL